MSFQQVLSSIRETKLQEMVKTPKRMREREEELDTSPESTISDFSGQ